MGFSCTGEIFTGLTLNTSDGKLLATITAAETWQDAKAEVSITMAGQTITKEINSLCEYIASGTCGEAGSVTLDLTSLVEGVDSSMISSAIFASAIEVSADQDGVTQTCTKAIGSSSSAYQMASPSKAASFGLFAIGAIALVGLASYAMKRRNRATSKTGADAKLTEGELA